MRLFHRGIISMIISRSGNSWRNIDANTDAKYATEPTARIIMVMRRWAFILNSKLALLQFYELTERLFTEQNKNCRSKIGSIEDSDTR